VSARPLDAQDSGALMKLSVQLGHSGSITALAVTRDGRYAVTGSDDKSLVVWEVATGREIRALQWHQGTITAIAIDDSGNVISAARDGSLARWSMVSGKISRVYVPPPREPKDFDYGTGNTRSINGLAVDSQGDLIAAATTEGVRMFDARGGTDRGFLDPENRQTAGAVAFVRGGLLISDIGGLRLWDLAARKPLRLIGPKHLPIRDVVVAPNGQYFVVTSGPEAAMWTLESTQPRQRFLHDEDVLGVAISADSRFVLTSSKHGHVALWSAETGTRIKHLDSLPAEVLVLGFASDSSHVLAGTNARVVGVLDWDVGFVRVFWPAAGFPDAIAVTAEQLLVSAFDSLIRRWDLSTGRPLPPLRGHHDQVTSLAVAAGGRLAVSGSLDSTVRLWDLHPGVERVSRTYRGHHAGVTSVAVDSTGRIVASATRDGEIKLWTLAPLDRPGPDSVQGVSSWGQVWSIALSKDGRRLLTAGDSGVRLCDFAKGRCRTSFRRQGTDQMTPAAFVRFSPRNYVLGTSMQGEVRIWDLEGNDLVEKINHEGAVWSAVFTPSGDSLYTAGDDKVVRGWRTADNGTAPAQRLAGHEGAVRNLTISPDGRLLYSASYDGTVRIWNPRSGQLVATLVIGRAGNGDNPSWTVVAPDGRFDTNALEDEDNGLHWIIEDDPMRPLPIEIFTRSHYEPLLLHRLLMGAPGSPLPNLRTLDRIQPQVSIESVTPIIGQPAFVRLTASVESSRHMYDLRLFRDGELVGTWPRVEEEPGGDIQAWRAAHAIASDDSGRARHPFVVRLPTGDSGQKVEFSAYAFNGDRVKSETARFTYRTRVPVRGLRRAYVVAIGVGDNEEPSRRLTYAAHDAATVLDSLTTALAATRQFDSIIPIPLMKDPPNFGLNIFPLPDDAAAPTKANIRTVLALLAGRRVEPLRRAAIPASSRLVAAAPQDLVLLYVSAHGVIDAARGEFVLLPMDIGNSAHEGQLSQAQIARGISSSELTQWFQGIDAGFLVMVLSTCNSEAAVARAGFRPGPMGDPGLGQLAYDKAMQILVAAQADTKSLGLTYLGSALVENGLAAIRSRTGGRRGLNDLLRYAESLVPELIRTAQGGTDASEQPQLFDFRRGRPDVPLAR